MFRLLAEEWGVVLRRSEVFQPSFGFGVLYPEYARACAF